MTSLNKLFSCSIAPAVNLVELTAARRPCRVAGGRPGVAEIARIDTPRGL
ncbi:MAG TPA: hypothetical protein VNI02_02470 [Blastocatellia bacterium]|nr:hypothetical protein [Blastocatellia bacterium]